MRRAFVEIELASESVECRGEEGTRWKAVVVAAAGSSVVVAIGMKGGGFEKGVFVVEVGDVVGGGVYEGRFGGED